MGRDLIWILGRLLAAISIHSPRMGRDVGRLQLSYAVPDFNPLSPHGERPGKFRP